MNLSRLRKAVFLDRDGVLIEDNGYPYLPEHLTLKTDILPHLRRLKAAGYLLVIVTNQSGIARGRFTLSQYRAFQELVEDALAAEGAAVDATYFCPYHEEGTVPEFSLNHEDRKPAPGLIIRAAAELDIDIETSIMIGDKQSDLIRLEGLRSFLIRGKYPVDGNVKIYDDYEELLKDAGIY